MQVGATETAPVGCSYVFWHSNTVFMPILSQLVRSIQLSLSTLRIYYQTRILAAAPSPQPGCHHQVQQAAERGLVSLAHPLIMTAPACCSWSYGDSRNKDSDFDSRLTPSVLERQEAEAAEGVAAITMGTVVEAVATTTMGATETAPVGCSGQS